MLHSIEEQGIGTQSREVEAWRGAELDRLNSKQEKILQARYSIRKNYYGKAAGTRVAPEDAKRLEELEKELSALQAEITQVEHEANMRLREPIDPEEIIAQASEALEQQRSRRSWLSYRVFYNRMEGYRQALSNCERRIRELELEIERAGLAKEYHDGLENQEAQQAASA